MCISDCFCDAECSFYNDCCFLGNHVDNTSLQENSERLIYQDDEECTFAVTNFEVLLLDDPDSNDIPSYMMSTKCNGVDYLKNNTHNDWGALEPVYSRSKHRIYVNNDCAKCNGAHDGEEWLRYVSCTNVSMDFYDMIANNVQDKYWVKNCVITFEPKSNIHLVSKKRCYQDVISTCSLTQSLFQKPYLSSNYIKDACESNFHDLYVRSLVRGVLIYKNIFCYLCNVPNPHINHKCYSTSGPIQNGKTSLAFSTIIIHAYEEETLSKKVENEIACLRNEDATLVSTRFGIYY